MLTPLHDFCIYIMIQVHRYVVVLFRNSFTGSMVSCVSPRYQRSKSYTQSHIVNLCEANLYVCILQIKTIQGNLSPTTQASPWCCKWIFTTYEQQAQCVKIYQVSLNVISRSFRRSN